jgi:hypothetical protein
MSEGSTMTQRRSRLSDSPFAAPAEQPVRPPDHFAVGDRVTSDRLGLGRVVSVASSGYLSVEFGGRVYQVGPQDWSISKL